MNPWAWALIFSARNHISSVHSLSHILLDHYFTPSPQNLNTSSTILILSSWPYFLLHWENDINQKRPSVDLTTTPIHWHLIPGTLLPLAAIDELSMLLTRVISSICAIDYIPFPLLKTIAPVILYLCFHPVLHPSFPPFLLCFTSLISCSYSNIRFMLALESLLWLFPFLGKLFSQITIWVTHNPLTSPIYADWIKKESNCRFFTRSI